MIKRVKYTINTFNGFRFCNKNCEDEEVKFICGSDGSLYRNYCEMKKAHCGRHVYQVFGSGGMQNIQKDFVTYCRALRVGRLTKLEMPWALKEF